MDTTKGFSGNPHCLRCGQKMTNFQTVNLPAGNGTSTVYMSYGCENCLSSVNIIVYLDPNANVARDTDGTRIKKMGNSFFPAYIQPCDTRLPADS